MFTYIGDPFHLGKVHTTWICTPLRAARSRASSHPQRAPSSMWPPAVPRVPLGLAESFHGQRSHAKVQARIRAKTVLGPPAQARSLTLAEVRIRYWQLQML